MSRPEWRGTNEFRRNTKTSGSESVARETKEILKDCHGNRCFGNRVLKAYRESALERENERRVRRGGCDREGVENEAEGETRERRKMDQKRRLSHSDAISDRVT